MVNRHKVFISYHHENDEDYKEHLLEMNKKFNMFDDYSVGDGDIDDTIPAESIRIKIRDEYIKDSTVLVLLCGTDTKTRKHIDWEIHAAMFDTEKNPKLGILVINLPSANNTCRANDPEEKKIVSPNANWITLNSRREFESYYPSMPVRIIDNLYKDVPISVIDWNKIAYNYEDLMIMIDKAFKRRKTNQYDHSRVLKGRNS